MEPTSGFSVAPVDAGAVDAAYFSRQMRLPGVGYAGQQRLATARVLVIGAGALGSPALTYLARAGVGHLTICDGDRVAYHNLHRQTLYARADVGRSKAEAARSALTAEFPGLDLVAVDRYLTDRLPDDNRPDIVLDCTDRFSSRFAVHDAARAAGVDLVSAAVGGGTGQLQVFRFSQAASPCLRCLYPDPPDDGCTGSCAEDGILGAAAGAIGSWQALLALHILLGLREPASATTFTVELATMELTAMGWDAREGCSCGAATDGEHAADRGPAKPAPGTAAAPATATDEVPAEDAATEGEHAVRGDAPPAGPFVIVDLREPEEITEVDRALLPGARHRPLDRFLADLDSLDRSESYLLVCEHGVRSAMARDAMIAAGFSSVADVEGGYAGLRSLLRGASRGSRTAP